MDAYLLDWVNLLLRWAHVITAIAWIGSSFYFVMLDNSLSTPEHADLKAKGVDGEMWAVHGGGFYHSNKYMVAPKWVALPDEATGRSRGSSTPSGGGTPSGVPGGTMKSLHWSYWESYSTWLTGFALFTALYLFNAGSFLVDKTVFDWSPGAAIGAALGFLAAFWLIYDGLCRTLGQTKNGDRIVGASVVVFVVFASWLACQLFAGRAAFLLVGAMLATAMSANVFFWIIPGQRAVVADLRAGRAPDPIHGQRGKQRSVHNTYFTLPVLIAMISNHYGWLTGAKQNWIVLVAMMLAGALIRHSFAARHKAHVLGQRAPWETAVVGTLILIGLAIWLAPPPPSASAQAAAVQPATWAQVQPVFQQRCVMCHNEQLANKGVALHTPALVRQHAQAVLQQAVILRTMPLNNATQITDDERALVKRWIEAGAPLP